MTGLTLTPPVWFVDDPILEIGESVSLRLEAEYSDDSTRNVTAEALWTSSNDHVATVDGGVITGQHRGGANVRAEYEGTTVGTPNFRVVRGPHVTVSNVRWRDFVVAPWIRVTGTVRNTGSREFPDYWEIWARCYSDNGTLLAEGQTAQQPIRSLPVGEQLEFRITVGFETDVLIGRWSYYTLEFLNRSGRSVPCAGCDERRR